MTKANSRTVHTHTMYINFDDLICDTHVRHVTCILFRVFWAGYQRHKAFHMLLYLSINSLLGNLKKSYAWKVGLQTRVQGNNPYHKTVRVKVIMKLPVVALYRCRGLVYFI